MKRVFFFFSSLLMTFLTIAQEKAQETEEAVENYEGWSNETKFTMLAVWGLVVLVLTVRTFRNKSDM